MAEAILMLDESKRLAVAACSRWLSVTLPSGTPGAYMLLRKGCAFYIGRSDHCLLTRLRSNPWVAEADHVAWEPCRTDEEAFRLEAAWFHILSTTSQLRNVIHPARPHNYSKVCPFCDAGDVVALKYLLPHLRSGSVSTALSTDRRRVQKPTER